MKIISALIFLFFFTPASAQIYKCIVNGNTTYQQTQCKQAGNEFTPKTDISIEQQQSAVDKLDAELKTISEQEKIQKSLDDKERLIRAKEENAKANRAQAEETARQTEAIKESNKRDNRDRDPLYYYPYRPIAKPKPGHPIVRPLPSRPAPTPASSRPQPLPSSR